MIIRRQVMFSDGEGNGFDSKKAALGAGALAAGGAGGYGTYLGIKSGARKAKEYLKKDGSKGGRARKYLEWADKVADYDENPMGKNAISKRERRAADVVAYNRKRVEKLAAQGENSRKILEWIKNNPKAAKNAGIGTAAVAGLGLAAAGYAGGKKLMDKYNNED